MATLASRIRGVFGMSSPDRTTPTKPKREDRQSTGSADEDEVREFISNLWPKLQSCYLSYHQMIWQSILFYVGQTWLTWDPYRKFYYPQVPEDEFTPQPKINRFSPAVDAVASNFSSIPPIEAVARDADGDEQSKRHGIARIASRLAKDFIMRQGLKSDFMSKGPTPCKAAILFVLCGGFHTAVRAVAKSPRDTPLGPVQEYTIEMDLLDNMVVIPRPGSETIGGQSGTPYLAIGRRMTLNEVWNRFQIVAEADVLFLDGYNSTYENALNFYYTGFNATDVQNEDSCLVVEWYVPPESESFPGIEEFSGAGLYAIWNGDALKWYSDWDFPEHPVTKFDYIAIPKMYFGRSIAFDLCDLQEELQQYEALIKLHAMCNAVDPWVVDSNTLVGEITGRADKVIKYRSIGPNSAPPKRAGAGSLDQGVYAKLAQIKEEFEVISGAASVFRGRTEGSITSGTAISQLRGQAQQMFSSPQMNWANGWKETVRKAVKFMQKYYSTMQILAICGTSGNQQAVADFKDPGTLLDDVVEWLASQHGTPQTMDEMKEEILNLFDRKAIDITQVEVKERIFELFGETGMMSQFNLDATRARMENRGMRQTPPVPPTFMPEIEDLQTHYNIHIEEIKALEFDQLPPPNKQLMLQHAMATKIAMNAPPPGMIPAAPLPPAGSPPPGSPPAPPPTGTGHLSSHGHPTVGTQHHGQGIQPIGASQGAPPVQPPLPGQPHP